MTAAKSTTNHIRLACGDITQAAVDAIVNAANSEMLGGGGVDGAIHRAAGPALLEACKRVPVVDGIRCPAGEARITEAGSLNARFVIHAVGPRYVIDPEPERLLAGAYRSSLDLALENGCPSVALPAISCGVYGYPLDDAAGIVVGACSEEPCRSLTLTFYLFGDDVMAAWSRALSRAD